MSPLGLFSKSRLAKFVLVVLKKTTCVFLIWSKWLWGPALECVPPGSLSPKLLTAFRLLSHRLTDGMCDQRKHTKCINKRKKIHCDSTTLCRCLCVWERGVSQQNANSIHTLWVHIDKIPWRINCPTAVVAHCSSYQKVTLLKHSDLTACCCGGNPVVKRTPVGRGFMSGSKSASLGLVVLQTRATGHLGFMAPSVLTRETRGELLSQGERGRDRMSDNGKNSLVAAAVKVPGTHVNADHGLQRWG